MRKLLLATVAVLGASIGVASVADAQTTSPAPGTVTVRLNGRFRFYAYEESNGNTGVVNTAQTGTGTGLVGAGANKTSNYGFADYIRLYPGFDGVAANGLKYGASIELRQDQVAAAGGGANGSVSAQDRARSGLYVRREWGYLGTDQLGTIRLGSTDQPSSLYMTGNFENFDGGGLNGDVPALVLGNAQITWPFSDVGSYYTTEKAVYLSPQLFGFDLGVSYEPSTANVSAQSNCNIAGSGCDLLSSTTINAESARRRNTVDALIRYRGSFGGFGLAATAGLIEGSHVLDNQAGVPFNNNPLNGAAIRRNYEGLSAGDFGIAVTYGGFSVGGKYLFGAFNGGIAGLQPKGVSHSEAFLVGASYTIGPVVVGAHYLQYKSAGDLTNAFYGRQRTENGVGYGGTYSLAPGVSLFLSGLWTQRKQNGYDFVTGAGVTTATGVNGQTSHNKSIANLISVGTSFSW